MFVTSNEIVVTFSLLFEMQKPSSPSPLAKHCSHSLLITAPRSFTSRRLWCVGGAFVHIRQLVRWWKFFTFSVWVNKIWVRKSRSSCETSGNMCGMSAKIYSVKKTLEVFIHMRHSTSYRQGQKPHIFFLFPFGML